MDKGSALELARELELLSKDPLELELLELGTLDKDELGEVWLEELELELELEEELEEELDAPVDDLDFAAP